MSLGVSALLWIVFSQVQPAGADPARCEGGDAAACVRHGERLRDAHPPSAISACAAFRRACDAGSHAGCRALGEMILRGVGGDADARDGVARIVAARAAFESQCARGDAQACDDAADLYAGTENAVAVFGLGDDRRARELYTRACERGVAASCARLAEYVVREVGGGGSRARAAALEARACAGGDPRGCESLAASIVSTDEARARHLFERACEQGRHFACARVGGLVLAHDATVTGLESAAAWFERGCTENDPDYCTAADDLHARLSAERACSAGDLLGCVRLAAFVARGVRDDLAPDEARASALVVRACDGGSIAGCTALAERLFDGRGVPRDAARAAALLDRGCRAGDLRACVLLGSVRAYGSAPDPAAARALYARACDGGEISGCTPLGVLYEEGRGVAPDPAAAARLYDVACDLGDGMACTHLANLHARGLGVAMNPRRAHALFQRALTFVEDNATRGYIFAAQRGLPEVAPAAPRVASPGPPLAPDAAALRAAIDDVRARVGPDESPAGVSRDPLGGLPRFELTRRRLQNGLDVVLARDGAAHTVEVSLTVYVGEGDSPPAHPGLAHLVEHLYGDASLPPSPDDPDSFASLGSPSSNAETGIESTEYWLLVGRPSLDRAVWALATQLGRADASVDDARLDLERRVIGHEMRERLSTWNQALVRLLLTTLPPGHPMHLSAATHRLDAVTRDEAVAFLRRWYVPSNARLVIVGDVDPAATMAAVERYFAPIEDRPAPTRPARGPGASSSAERELRVSTPDGRDRVAYVWTADGEAEGPGAVALWAADRAMTRAAQATPLYGVTGIRASRPLGPAFVLASIAAVRPGASQESALRGLDERLRAGLDGTLAEGALEAALPELIAAMTRDLQRAADDRRTRVRRIARWPDADDPGAFRRELRAIQALRADDVRAAVRAVFDPRRRLTVRVTHDPGSPPIQDTSR